MWELLSAANPTESIGPALTQIGIGALIAVPAYAVASVLWRDRSRTDLAHTAALAHKDEQITALQLARVADLQAAQTRERELADRLGPLLAEAVKVQSVVPERIKEALREASSARNSDQIEQLVRRLETLTRSYPPREGGAG